MTPHRDAGVGTFILDIRLGRLGRVKRASGTLDLDVLADVKATIKRLRKERKWDLLALVANGRVTPLELCEAVWNAKLGELPTAEDAQPLSRLVELYVSGLDLKPRTVQERERNLTNLAGATSSVADLPQLLETGRRAAIKSGTRSMFNHTLSDARMLADTMLGPDHPVTKAVFRIDELDVDKREGNPQTPDQIQALATKLGRHGHMVWSLCLSGMRVREYLSRNWANESDRISLAGSKTKAGKNRVAPLIYPLTQPTVQYRRFKQLVHDASSGTVTCHDFRYTWMNWLGDAGVDKDRVRWYAGHQVVDVNELYRRGRGFHRFLGPDGETLRTWLGDRKPAAQLAVAR